MKNKTQITEAQLLLNQEVRIKFSTGNFTGRTGMVNKIMADDRTLEVTLDNGKVVFLDVTLVSEIQEPYNWPKQEQSLGPIANSVVKDTI